MPLIDGIKQNIVTPEAGINVRVDAFVLDNNSIFFFRNKHIYYKTVASNESFISSLFHARCSRRNFRILKISEILRTRVQ